jgi:hypothetical protein
MGFTNFLEQKVRKVSEPKRDEESGELRILHNQDVVIFICHSCSWKNVF